ncbi:MAG: hypothetical protein HRU09_11880 [Oligoflexales bacterium]|nr:hypothetical protein [Oligoflexales bacterium]
MIRVMILFLSFLFGLEAMADEYPHLYRSAYFLGRGDTGIATADNEDAIFYNPAGIARGKGIYKEIIFAAPMVEVSQDTRDVVKKVSIQEEDPTETLREHQGRPQHLGLNAFSGVILRRAVIGVFGHSSNTALLYKDPDKGALESILAESIVDTGAVFALAQNFGKSILMGLSLKFIRRNQAYFQANATDSEKLNNLTSSDQISMSGSGTGVDLGFVYQTEGRTNFSVGLTVSDVGNTILVPDKETTSPKSERALKDIKQTVNTGIAIETGAQSSKFKILLDARDLLSATGQDPSKRLHVGTELSLKGFIGFTGGMNQGYPTFGTFMDIRFLRIDMGIYGEEIGEQAGSRPDTRYYFKLHLGL